MNPKKKLRISVAFIVIIIAIFVISSNRTHAPTESQNSSDSQNNAQTYSTYINKKYGFQFQYPNTWQVSENTDIPVINVYKKSEINKPPFTIHSSSTAIAIFPQGLGTEGPLGQTKEAAIKLGDRIASSTDYILKDGSVWAHFVLVPDGPKDKGWVSYAFIWAGVHVDNEQLECMVENREKPLSECGDVGIEYQNSWVIKAGSIDNGDMQLEETILKSFKFIK